MSITDELREWVKSLYTPNSGELKLQAERIADRIDAEHEKAAAGCIHYDPERHYCAVHGDTENGWIRLPVDADGVPIHVGDRLTDSAEFKSEGVVESLMLEQTGWSAHFGAGWADERIHDWHHHYPPTVEDVLDEFVARWMDTHHDDLPALKAEYAAKLRLAGDGE